MVPALAPFSSWPRGLVRECCPAGRPWTSTSLPRTSNRWSSQHLSSPQPVLVIVAGILCLSVFSLCSSPSIFPPVSLLRYGMVGTVAGDGAPRSLSDVRSLGVRWTRPFSFSDSSLVGRRPFSLLSFHPARARLGFVALSCLLRYRLGFYLNWQPLTTVSPFFKCPILNNSMCYMLKPIFTILNGWASKSQLSTT